MNIRLDDAVVAGRCSRCSELTTFWRDWDGDYASQCCGWPPLPDDWEPAPGDGDRLMRDYSRLFRDGVCVLCGQSRHIVDAHAEIHLARGDAVVVVDYRRKSGRTEQVVPMETMQEVAPGEYQLARKLDPKLRRIVRAALRAKKASAAVIVPQTKRSA